MKNEYYFCLYLTENEHSFVEEMIKEFCKNNQLQLKYYKKFKLGHIPMYREIKVIGKNINRFKKWMKNEKLKTIQIPDYARPKKRIEIDKKLKELGL